MKQSPLAPRHAILFLTPAFLASAALAVCAWAADSVGKAPPAVAASQPTSSSKPAAEGKTNPPGLPLKATLVCKKESFAIPAGQSGKEFAKELQTPSRPPKKPPAPPQVDMTLEIANTGTKAVTINLGGDMTRVELKLEGPGAVTVPYTPMHTMEFRMGVDAKIEPGKSVSISIPRLQFGNRGDSEAAYWTEPGEYTLTASYVTPVNQEEKPATITAAPIQIKVMAEEKAK